MNYGFIILVVAIVLVYGADIITNRIIKPNDDMRYRTVLILKVVGFAATILAMLKIMEII